MILASKPLKKAYEIHYFLRLAKITDFTGFSIFSKQYIFHNENAKLMEIYENHVFRQSFNTCRDGKVENQVFSWKV